MEIIVDAREGIPDVPAPQPPAAPEAKKPEAPPVVEKPPEVPKVDPVAALQKRLDDMELRLRNQDKAIQRKEEENKRLKESLESRETDQTMTKAMLAVLAKSQGKREEEFEQEVKQNQPDLVKEFEGILKQQEEKKKQDQLTAKVREYQDRTESLGLEEDDPAYLAIQSAVIIGNFISADKVLSKLERAKAAKQEAPPAPQPKPEPAKAEDVNKLAEEKARQIVEPMLKVESGRPAAPSGQVFTVSQVQAMDHVTFRKHFPNGFTDFMQAMKDGKVKE